MAVDPANIYYAPLVIEPLTSGESCAGWGAFLDRLKLSDASLFIEPHNVNAQDYSDAERQVRLTTYPAQVAKEHVIASLHAMAPDITELIKQELAEQLQREEGRGNPNYRSPEYGLNPSIFAVASQAMSEPGWEETAISSKTRLLGLFSAIPQRWQRVYEQAEVTTLILPLLIASKGHAAYTVRMGSRSIMAIDAEFERFPPKQVHDVLIEEGAHVADAQLGYSARADVQDAFSRLAADDASRLRFANAVVDYHGPEPGRSHEEQVKILDDYLKNPKEALAHGIVLKERLREQAERGGCWSLGLMRGTVDEAGIDKQIGAITSPEIARVLKEFEYETDRRYPAPDGRNTPAAQR